MPKKEQKDKTGSTGRFGSRYGTRVRERVKEVEERTKGLHQCPECRSKKVKRAGSGIWKCNRCGAKFSAKAHTPATTPIKKEVTPETEVEENHEADEKEESE